MKSQKSYRAEGLRKNYDSSLPIHQKQFAGIYPFSVIDHIT